MASASSMRSFGGKKVSRSSAPSLSMGGFCTSATRVARSTARPARQALSSRFDSRIWSRLFSGSASRRATSGGRRSPNRCARPARPHLPADPPPAAPAIAVSKAAARCPSPACRWRHRRRRGISGCARASDPTPQGRRATARRPWRRNRRWKGPCAALPRHRPAAKSRGARFGKVSIRLPRSPFGSMQIAGMPSMAASSSKARHRPVLPLPVMPTHTACVVRSRESYSSGSVASLLAPASNTLPR